MLLAIIIILFLLALNIILLRKNDSVPIPAGCESLKPDCEMCGQFDCSLKHHHLEKKEKED